MIGSRRKIGGGSSDNSWPGFVDALSSLLLVIIFLLSMFVLAQFFLGKTLSGREEALAELRGKVKELGDLLQVEQKANVDLRASIGNLSASLSQVNAERDQLDQALQSARESLKLSDGRVQELTQMLSATDNRLNALQTKEGQTSQELKVTKELSARQKLQLAALEQNVTALRDQLARLETALEASEERDKKNQAVIVELGSRLNKALASKVEELAGYRSEFFGRLKQVLQDQPGIRIEGDRFVFASELLFTSGSAELGQQGRGELRKFAETLLILSREIPGNLSWVLRVDGHTDRVPISSAQFASNWELSAARAISVVKYLIIAGVPAERLAATGFGQHQPLDDRDTQEAYSKNRRIEMRLDQR
ncbi:peptidoglycan -binding protein [Temperatibacter marinus]|uniref:Peptidoglycan -binding protein n=1 Tax=Temperatibacter marinus TaxID=1456591 RepID=A0AA52H886_9PROT|nr:peptidoglycan -binding protein [Temperatibacter marinus]WND01866.1 peptidoglycan -binding protein [Temperatibacter marinus]